MKYKLLSISHNENFKEYNIGDYIQALAASQYLPHIDGFIDREEELDKYDGEQCSIIMNGWFMHCPQNWPPSDSINPLFVSFHLNTLAKRELCSKDSIDYFKKHQPIGCRDINTKNILQSFGVDAYFSACLTLTLGKKYSCSEKSEKTFIVDPIISTEKDLMTVVNGLLYSITHLSDIIKLVSNPALSFGKKDNCLVKYIKTALFHKEYSRVFGRDFIMNSHYVNQQSIYYKDHFTSDFDRLKEAERLIKEYARAKFVVTSRIHCALPCLGLGTPVIFLERGKTIEADSCRMEGVRDFFNIITVEKNHLFPLFSSELPITLNNWPQNKKNWKDYSERLFNTCSTFTGSLSKR